MNKRQTESTFFESKVILRINNLPQKKEISVLDCFSADGKIWNEIKKRTEKKLTVTRIEKQVGRSGVYLQGNNIKFLKTLNVNDYDIIDLDSFGSPIKQLEIIFNKSKKESKKTIFFVTFIQSYAGGLPYVMLEKIGYTKKMIKKIPTLFYRNGIEKFKNYLSYYGVKKIKIMTNSRKHYIMFER